MALWEWHVCSSSVIWSFVDGIKEQKGAFMAIWSRHVQWYFWKLYSKFLGNLFVHLLKFFIVVLIDSISKHSQSVVVQPWVCIWCLFVRYPSFLCNPRYESALFYCVTKCKKERQVITCKAQDYPLPFILLYLNNQRKTCLYYIYMHINKNPFIFFVAWISNLHERYPRHLYSQKVWSTAPSLLTFET